MKKLAALICIAAGFFLTTGTVIAQAPVKKVLLEEFTTTLCGMCPPQSQTVKDWYENHPQNSILMVHHAGFGTDSMTNSVNTTICNYFDPSSFGFAPAIMIDRDVYPWVDSVAYMSVNGFDTIADRISQDPAVVGIDIQGTYNSSTRSLSVTATATFVSSLTSYDRRIIIYLVEDSIIGSGNGWDQKCYSSTYANTYYPGQWNSSTQYISGFDHRHVVRAALGGGIWGTAGQIPNTPVAGTPYTTTTTYTVPSNFDDSRLTIVAFVAQQGPNKYTRKVLNANDVEVTSVFSTTGTFITETNSASINLVSFPNPASGIITAQYSISETCEPVIYFMNIHGEMIMPVESRGTKTPGRYQEEIDLTELSAGMYFLCIETPHGRSVQRVLKQ